MIEESWEQTIYRCPICICIFSGDSSDNTAPFVICRNLHNICKGCVETLEDNNDSRCPVCRCECKETPLLNRDLTYMINIIRIPCGLCSNKTIMSWQDAHKHTNECPENMIICPMTSNNIKCQQHMSVSKLWEHCISDHSDNSQQTVPEINIHKYDENCSSATFSVSCDILSTMQFVRFFTIQDETQKLHLCLHIDTNSEKSEILVYVRRFFNPVECAVEKIIVSIETGMYSGLVLDLADTISCNDIIAHDKGPSIDVRTITNRHNTLNLPILLLHQMKTTKITDNRIIHMQVTIQLVYVRAQSVVMIS